MSESNGTVIKLKQRCKATTKSGKPCRSSGVMENGLCMGHQPKELQASRGFGGVQPNGGRPRVPRATELMRQRVEEQVDKVLKPYEDALTAESAVIVSVGDGSGGYDQHIEFVVDHNTRMKAASSLLDRVYGRPIQSTQITGADGAPLIPPIMIDEQVASDARTLLRRVAAASGD